MSNTGIESNPPQEPPYPACAVAYLVLQEAFAQGIEDIANMKINKLVYITHGWHLGLFGRSLIEEAVGAWNHGPVIAALYYWVRYRCEKYPGDPIKKNGNGFSEHRIVPPDAVSELIRRVVRLYGEKDAWELSELTHRAGSPWDKVTQRDMTSIPNDLIQRYYRERIDF